MNRRSVGALALIFVALFACGDDEATDPTADEPPEVTIIDAPFSVAVGETVEILYRATDDRGLSLISVSWGTVEAPVELAFPSGREFEDVATYEYSEPDSFLITVSATDSDGQTDRAEVEVDVEP